MSIFDKLKSGAFSAANKAVQSLGRERETFTFRVWFLWDQFLLVGIREPRSTDPWA